MTTTSPSSKGTSSSIRRSAVAATARPPSCDLEGCARELIARPSSSSSSKAHERSAAVPIVSFAAHRGYRVAEENVRRDLEWPRPAGELDRLWEEWAPFAEDYEIISWTDATPEDLVDARAHLSAIMPAETPHVDIDVEAEHWDATRVRLHEATTERMGRDLLVAAARHRASGELVGYSELTVSRDQPQTAYQWDTLVVRRHRGHRLGGS